MIKNDSLASGRLSFYCRFWNDANDIPKVIQICYCMLAMRSVQRVIVYGDNVALLGIKASLSLDPGCEVISQTMGASQQELCRLHPDVLIFELDAVPLELLYAVSKDIPGLLLIGIDPESNRAQLWSGQQAQGWTSQDLAQVIHRARFNIPSSRRKK